MDVHMAGMYYWCETFLMRELVLANWTHSSDFFLVISSRGVDCMSDTHSVLKKAVYRKGCVVVRMGAE